ncbi:hypothetical protein MYP_3013 [Sporocytophaga myxococcoides]|uniref:Uncharacterized protein n=1 Tax=Sporocytophaga myxococcoides TaxID=153721 RepID=A0A098LH66_9BACT|nr:hypothetical protein MYP_3013 [Sporocytophaga myxococcoides]
MGTLLASTNKGNPARIISKIYRYFVISSFEDNLPDLTVNRPFDAVNLLLLIPDQVADLVIPAPAFLTLLLYHNFRLVKTPAGE